nr:MAG TPA: hypothetical protein [Caudoviricetes sp.]
MKTKYQIFTLIPFYFLIFYKSTKNENLSGFLYMNI